MPALVPLSKRARAKTVPAAGASVSERSKWMSNRSAFSVSESERLERLAPATMRMALLTKRAKVKREIEISQMENERQDLIA
jgi:hypothetical protein